MDHPAFQSGRAAVITGAIGLAAAKWCARRGMNICMTDQKDKTLALARAEVASIENVGEVLAVPADVADLATLKDLNDSVRVAFGDVAFLMNNAIVRHGGGCLDEPGFWRDTLDIGIMGVVNGCQAFVPAMMKQVQPSLVVNAGSKQGITNPPGRPHYNVAKAAVKAYTELLEHELRNTQGCKVSVHLMAPGFTRGGPDADYPAGAWSPKQLIDYLMPRLARGDFYVICPDNEVTEAMDRTRTLWGAMDVTENRPPLTRWHPDFKDAFAAFKP
ncbi:MAG: SDR family NAD(P)-dependent oxidoreductase [Rhodospirillaceae bacterium]